MNSVDDFAAMRPEVESLDSADFDRVWSEIAGTNRQPVISWDSAHAGRTLERTNPDSQDPQQRRLAVLGAAAAFVLGVVGVAILAAVRDDAPDAVQDAVVVDDPVEVITTRTVDALGTVPQWQIPDAAWSLTAFEEADPFPWGAKVWAAVIDGNAAAGWVIVYPTSLDYEVPIAPYENRVFATLTGINVDVVPSDPSNLTMNWGGYLQAEASLAADIARERDPGTPIAFDHQVLGFEGAADMARSWTYEFVSGDSGDGAVIEVEVRGGGDPLYSELSPQSAILESSLPEGVDSAKILLDETLVMQSGFWITTASSPTLTGEEIADALQQLPEAERTEVAQPLPTVDASVLGESPEWIVNAPGWTQVESEELITDSTSEEVLRLFVDRESPAERWVVVAPTEWEEIPAPPPETDVSEPSAQVIEIADVSYFVNAGGIDLEMAAEVARAAVERRRLPWAVVEVNPAQLSDAVNLRRTEFVGPGGVTIRVDIEGGGVSNYIGKQAFGPTEVDAAWRNADESFVRVIGGDRSAVVRTGFWVSTISVEGAAPADFTNLSALVQLVEG